jgi:hypothetical protein
MKNKCFFTKGSTDKGSCAPLEKETMTKKMYVHFRSKCINKDTGDVTRTRRNFLGSFQLQQSERMNE